MILNNCKVKWAHVHEPDSRFPPPSWSVNIYLDPDQLTAVAKEGVPFKTDDDGPYIQAKRKTKNQKGSDVKPPRVVDMMKKPFTEEIGNGSICNVIVQPYDWTFGGKKGRGMWLDAIQVGTWDEYKGNEDFGEPVGAVSKPSVEQAADESDLPF